VFDPGEPGSSTEVAPGTEEAAVGIPIENGPLPPTDDEEVVPEPAPPERSPDPEAPEADAVEQGTEVLPGWRVDRVHTEFEVPEADAVDQAMELPESDVVAE
jgi:hypothetical protein